MGRIAQDRSGPLSQFEINIFLTFDRLKKLKSECGGIQTLMKNNKQLLVVEKGKVRIRNWKIGSDEKWNPNPNLYKTRICNFIRFHPNGCPRDPRDCPFAHNDSEKVKVDFDKIKRRKV